MEKSDIETKKMKIAIFGSGHFGKCAFNSYGAANVLCFIDNNPNKSGMTFEGIPIVNLEEYIELDQPSKIVIAVDNFVSISEQLRNEGIQDYEIYNPFFENELMHIKNEIKGIKNRIVLFGIDAGSELIYRTISSIGIADDQIVISDSKLTEERTFLTEKFKYTALADIPKDVKCLIVSSRNRAYALSVYLEKEFKETLILNPFTLKMYGDENKLIMNPYEGRDHDITENEWIIQNNTVEMQTALNEYMDELNKRNGIFEHIEIETFNRCNGVCNFCPVSVGNEKRKKKLMSEDLFYKIIDQLAEINYKGRLATFSNNEPFLDKRVVDFNKYAREKLPKARLHLFTNGTVLKLQDFIRIIEYLDEIVIDNYNQDLKLIPSVQKIVSYCEEHPELIRKVTVVTRKPYEIRTSRGGDAPNRERSDYLKEFGCVMPFKQMVVRPDGKVSLCCNDPYGKYTLGDLTKNTVEEVWFSDSFKKLREAMLKGRGTYGDCRYCDTTLLF